MRWQRLALSSAAALLVAPSGASWASCYLPMGTFQSDHIAQQPAYWDTAEQNTPATLGNNSESALDSGPIERLRQWLKVSREDPQLVRPLLTPSIEEFYRQQDRSPMPAAAGKGSGGSTGLESVGQDGRPKGDTLLDLTGSASLDDGKQVHQPDLVKCTSESKQVGEMVDQNVVLRLNVLLLVIGTRGDVQPMAALGRVLKERFGHRVRLATHAPFKSFVESQGLEFYPMPGNPNFLIDQMVSTSHSAQWSLPSSPAGILAVRKWFRGIIFSQWPACTAPPLQAPQRQDSVQPTDAPSVSGTPPWALNMAAAEAAVQEEETGGSGSDRRQNGLPPKDDVRHLTPPGIGSDVQAKPLLQASLSSQQSALSDARGSFSPDLIVATPTTQVALSCAQKLGVPLHIFYFMPYTQTRHIPHPLSGAALPGPDGSKGTSFTWSLLESVAAVGVWDYVNRFRKQVLHLPFLPFGVLSEFFLLDKLGVPTTYAFSPDLVPKPKDWGEHIRIVNYAFDDGQAARYQPSPLLQRFLDGGAPPVYIGFGSMKVEDPEELMDTILTAVKAAGVRAIIHKRGWADNVEELQNRLALFGANRKRPFRKSTSLRQRSDSIGAASFRERRASGSFVSEDILVYEEDVPHAWLFARCAAVVTHGGAGTVGAALRAGKPVVVVPFWGDQFLWGQLVAAAGVGPSAVPVSQLTEASLASALDDVRQDGMMQAAARIGEKIRGSENGVQGAAAHIQECLPTEALRCDSCQQRPARVWACTKLHKLCTHCAQDLLANPLKAPELLPYRPVEWRFTKRRGSCWGLCPESVFTPGQMREADWRSSAAVRQVVGTFVGPRSSLQEEEVEDGVTVRSAQTDKHIP